MKPGTVFRAAAFAIAAVLLIGLLVFQALGGAAGLQRMAIERTLEPKHASLFEDGRLHVFTLGTGSPQPGSGRMPAANAIIAGKELLIIDAGEGASRTMGDLSLPLDRTSAVFITHWHSDHFSGLGALLNASWNMGRSHALNVYGPPGIDRVISGLSLVYTDDIRYRSSGEVEEIDSANALGVPVAVNPAPEKSSVVFDRNGVVVRAFRVDHGHIDPAFGYRIDYNGRCVTFSGDTVATPRVAKAAAGCDVLVHEAINSEMIRGAAAVLRDNGSIELATRAERLIDYHADTIATARIAAEAGVRKLILTHLIPWSRNRLVGLLYTSGMSEEFGGEIIVADDGQRFDI
jgi:ribonuclease Z